MKKIFKFLTLIVMLLWSASAFPAGTTTPSYIKINDSGFLVTVTATADSSNAAFVPLFIDGSNSRTGEFSSYYEMLFGRWLTSVRTTISGGTAPTANYDIYILDTASRGSDLVLEDPGLAIGATTTAVATSAFPYLIDNLAYTKAAVGAGTAPGNDVIVTAKYGAVAFDIGADGTIDAIEATNQAAEQFATAALAIAALPAAASDHVRLGYITATKSDGAFTFGTTDLNAANTTVTYTSTIPAFDIMGGRLKNRSATVSQEVFPANTASDNIYYVVRKPLSIIIVNNSVNSAAVTIDLLFN